MKILLAGPGTGKTYKIREIIKEDGDGKNFLILSFTNATVNDLQKDLSENGVDGSNCMTLHKFAIKFNHDRNQHILLPSEQKILAQISKQTGIKFDQLCEFLECTTFDQVISRFVDYVKTNPLYITEQLGMFDTLIVDEYQDFNPTEQALIDVLIEKFPQSYILGDDDQCIYDFKDASGDKIISLYTDDSNEKVQHEHICYRCPDKVVEHATNLIANNENRVEKDWIPNKKSGELLFQQLKTFGDVANDIFTRIEKIPDNEDILILSPVGFAVQPIIGKFEKESVEFSNYFTNSIPQSLVEKSWEVKSVFGQYQFLNLVLLGYRVLSTRKPFYELLKEQFSVGMDYAELKKFLNKKLPTNLKTEVDNLEEFLEQEECEELYELYNQAEGTTEEEKLENLFKRIQADDDNAVKVMSIHKSKGLGADHVFVVGLNEGILPNVKKGNDTLEAQRRLFYVGITRAKKQLYLYSNIEIEGKFVNRVNKSDFRYNARTKLWNGKSSRFINELKL